MPFLFANTADMTATQKRVYAALVQIAMQKTVEDLKNYITVVSERDEADHRFNSHVDALRLKVCEDDFSDFMCDF